jgi:iron complex transport system ATP-binding protein
MPDNRSGCYPVYPGDSDDPDSDMNIMLKIQNLSINIDLKAILSNIHLECTPGSLTGIIGPNGAGKSSLLRAIVGIWHPNSGQIDYQQQSLFLLSGKKRAQILTYLPQNMLYEKGHRVDEFILLANHPWRGVPERSNLEQRLQEALTICNIEHLRDRYLHTLSGGEKQRVFLAQVVFQDTPVILLDEPTTFLDFKHVLHIEDVLKYLLNKRKIILCVTHDLYMAQHLSTHILALKNGNTYASGATADILNVQLISQLFEIAEPYVEQRFRF